MVSVTFFCKATRALERLHGNRLCEPNGFNRLIEALGQAEILWQQLPAATPEKKDAPPCETAGGK